MSVDVLLYPSCQFSKASQLRAAIVVGRHWKCFSLLGAHFQLGPKSSDDLQLGGSGDLTVWV